jgi:hypothetical protein
MPAALKTPMPGPAPELAAVLCPDSALMPGVPRVQHPARGKKSGDDTELVALIAEEQALMDMAVDHER